MHNQECPQRHGRIGEAPTAAGSKILRAIGSRQAVEFITIHQNLIVPLKITDKGLGDEFSTMQRPWYILTPNDSFYYLLHDFLQEYRLA